MADDLDPLKSLQPKVIDGKLRFPLHMELPDKAMVCPKCGAKGEITSEKTALGKRIFKCPNPGCKVKQFAELRKSKVAWCKRHQRQVTGADCRGCFQFKKHGMEWIQGGQCPDFVLGDDSHPDLKPEGFEKG